MFKLLLLSVVGVLALGTYNYSAGRDLFHLPGARTLQSTLSDTVSDTVRNGVRHAARDTGAEVTQRAAVGARTAANRAGEVVTSAALTSKIKAKMALDDLVVAADIDVDTKGSVVTLTGEVGSADERRRAVRIATETAGVTKVVNQLHVR
jgi:hyperosmotically inducible periplasmic protein